MHVVSMVDRETDSVESGNMKPSSSQKRTCLERVLILTLAAMLVAVVVLAVLLAHAKSRKDKDVCLTKECTQVAARVLGSIDHTVNPCDNFYDFACGTWIKKNVVPEERSNLYTYGVVRENIKVTLKYLIEGTQDNHVEAVRKARSYYKACMNETHIEQLNTSVLTDLLTELGGWPTLGNQPGGHWNQSTFDLTSDLVSVKLYKISPIIRMYIGPDYKNTLKRIIYIDQPVDLAMRNRDYILSPANTKMRDAYLNYVTNIAVMLGADRSVAVQDMKDTFELDRKLANVSLSKMQLRMKEKLYNRMTLRELENSFSSTAGIGIKFKWTSYIQRVMALAEENVVIDANEPVVVATPNYYRHLMEILRHEKPRTIRNYIMRTLVEVMVTKLPKRFTDEAAKYQKAHFGTNLMQSRWKLCSFATMTVFGMAIGRLFVKETFDEEAKQQALEMIHDIRTALYQRIDELDWMDAKTKLVAKEKARAVKEQIGYPDFILDDYRLDAFYQVMKPRDNEYFLSTVHFMQVYSKTALQRLRYPYNRDVSSQIMPPPAVNAYYDPVGNLIGN